MEEQSYKSHAKRDMMILFVLLPLNTLILIAALVHVYLQPSPANVLVVPVALSLFLLMMKTRGYATKNQDRIIRLEETLRLRSLGGDPAGITEKQFVALRFASDAEVVALAARAKAEAMEPKAIKAAIQTWRPDYNRV